MMWLLLLFSLSALALAGIFYLAARVHRFSFLQTFGKKHKILAWLCSALPVAALGLFALINIFALIIAVVHILIIWMLCDLAALVCRKLRKKDRKRYYAEAAAILLSAGYLSAGWFLAHHVFETAYRFDTVKEPGGGRLRVVEIADLHLGITLDGQAFGRELERIQETAPDLVAICGDFVDDDTKKADMITACEALGRLRTTYGVYFVYGNHDKGYYNTRDFTLDELRSALEKNGVVILEDDAILVNDSFYVIGRQDRSTQDRMDINTLTEDLDGSKYMLVLDHQPGDYANEAAAGVDLVLSGHTHGGHIFPAGFVGVWIGANDRFYGTEARENTRFLVSSGISGWAIPFKTGAISEYVVIDIVQKG